MIIYIITIFSSIYSIDINKEANLLIDKFYDKDNIVGGKISNYFPFLKIFKKDP